MVVASTFDSKYNIRKHTVRTLWIWMLWLSWLLQPMNWTTCTSTRLHPCPGQVPYETRHLGKCDWTDMVTLTRASLPNNIIANVMVVYIFVMFFVCISSSSELHPEYILLSNLRGAKPNQVKLMRMTLGTRKKLSYDTSFCTRLWLRCGLRTWESMERFHTRSCRKPCLVTRFQISQIMVTIEVYIAYSMITYLYFQYNMNNHISPLSTYGQKNELSILLFWHYAYSLCTKL
jgi:hypothetical protein